MTEAEISRGIDYGARNITDLGYKLDRSVNFGQPLSTGAFKSGVFRYRRGNERCLVVNENGLCKVVGYFVLIEGRKK